MPRTTIDLDASVLRELKARQRLEHKTLGQIASELLSRALAEDINEVPPFDWHTASMGEPYVDIDDKEAVWAALDSSNE